MNCQLKEATIVNEANKTEEATIINDVNKTKEEEAEKVNEQTKELRINKLIAIAKANENENSEYFNKIEKMLTELEENDLEEVEALLEVGCFSVEEAIKEQKNGDFYYVPFEFIKDKLYDNRLKFNRFEAEGDHPDFIDLAQFFLSEGYYGEIEENLALYLDFECMARELMSKYDEVSNGFIILCL
jgi:hypothetical protein